LVIKKKALIAPGFQNLMEAKHLFFQVISIFWPLCKKMLLKKLFADNIFSVSQGSRPGSLNPLSVVGRADSPFAVNKSARFSGKVSYMQAFAGSRG
jgi:hypothetical protein